MASDGWGKYCVASGVASRVQCDEVEAAAGKSYRVFGLSLGVVVELANNVSQLLGQGLGREVQLNELTCGK